MNRKYDILFRMLMLLVAGGCFQACQQDAIDDTDPYNLVAQGRYLAAHNAETVAALEDPDKTAWFEVGTPYRLLAFTKPYDKANADNDENDVNEFRFNTVAWEGEAPNRLRFINIEHDPDKWFGFSAIGDETPGDDGLVSLDFYGFTYGKKAERESYIELDNLADHLSLDDAPLESLKRTEKVVEAGDPATVSPEGELNDLMRGMLLNQNISTAGIYSSTATQSIVPFTHCFSKLRFMVVQDKNDKGEPSFPDIRLEKVELTGTYGEGAVSLKDGRVQLAGDPISRTVRFKDSYNGAVPFLQQVDVGEMIVFPSDGAALSNDDLTDGYTVGLKITVNSSDRNEIEHFLVNTQSPEVIEEYTAGDGSTRYRGTVVKSSIIDNFYNTDIRFKQNTSYILVLSFQKGAVRIITVIPQIEEWLNGEGTEKDPWQNQALGQPEMFDNIVWSDRNMGADHFDPTGADYEKTVGYFYQSGRNIPYYPFKYADYTAGTMPDLQDKHKQDLANGNSKYRKSVYRFFPIVDHYFLTNAMTGNSQWTMYNYDTDVEGTKGKPQMKIPETAPADRYFDFLRGEDAYNTGLKDSEGSYDQNMHWEEGQSNQPVAGAWVVPSSSDFLSIFPSTPHAGNITFRRGSYNNDPMSWRGDAMESKYKTLRVTVPYYYEDMAYPARNDNAKYTEAWNRLKENNDAGTTHIDGDDNAYKSEGDYILGVAPGAGGNPNYEPNGDPEDGYASVYIISREGDDEEAPAIVQNENYVIKSWGAIYAIKRVYTSEAYRMRWRVRSSTATTGNPCFYIEICRYRCNHNDTLTETNYKDFDWDHPAATIYFPICGLGDWTGEYINFGTECQYATSDPIKDGKTGAVQIKITGNDAYNAYIAVVRNVINRNFGKQLRPIGGGYNGL